LVNDERLQELVPRRSVTFRGPLVRVGPRTDEAQVVATMMPEGAAGEPMPAIVARSFGRGKVVIWLPPSTRRSGAMPIRTRGDYWREPWNGRRVSHRRLK
jgi:hypothetical protein